MEKTQMEKEKVHVEKELSKLMQFTLEMEMELDLVSSSAHN
ncbi:MAG: hypothetical protein ABH804_02420 [archaeon]